MLRLMDWMEQKSSLFPAVLIVAINSAECIRLRAAPPDLVQDSSAPLGTEWTTKNIVGLAGAILVLISLFLSFIFVGKLRRTSARLKVMQVAIVAKMETIAEEEQHAGTQLPISAVIKVNSENPHHFVVPVDDQVDGSRSKQACQFEVERAAFDATTFSLIVREGNIPIHFETLSGAKLARVGEPVPGSKNSKQIRLLNVQPDEAKLRNKDIVFVYELQ